MINVLDHGHVSLVEHNASDLSVVNSARVSFNKRHQEILPGDEGLINYLIRERHGSTTEHNSFTFDIRCPIFVAREWVRHRIGSFNEVSLRYTDIDPEFYIPRHEDVRIRVGKPGHYTYEQAPDEETDRFLDILTVREQQDAADYHNSIDDGIAPELARMMLSVNVYTQFYWTVNARALMNFLSLRTAPTAQLEIRRFAEAVETFFAEKMPLTHKAWVDNGRIAP